jgi:hypothetical protein
MNYIITAVIFDQENIATSDPGKEGSTSPAPKLVKKQFAKTTYSCNIAGKDAKLTGADLKAKIKTDLKLADNLTDITLKTSDGKDIAEDAACEVYSVQFEATKPYVAQVKG